ncbi:MAG: PDZ domain-containing protein, partial [Pseudolabrys sp.]
AGNVGFRRGDIIVSVNNHRIEKTHDLARVADRGYRSWRVVLRRGGRQITAVVGG